jgi:hypothetical protein
MLRCRMLRAALIACAVAAGLGAVAIVGEHRLRSRGVGKQSLDVEAMQRADILARQVELDLLDAGVLDAAKCSCFGEGDALPRCRCY